MNTKWLTTIKTYLDRTANPIVLQEVRTLLSLSRTILVFGMAVFVLSVSSCQSVELGSEFPVALMLGTFSIVSVLVLPAQIMFSSNNRWSQDKLEMLNLTQLRPTDIVVGRVLAGFVMVALFGSLMLPFLGLTYLLPGVRIAPLLVFMLGIGMASLLAITITINIGWHMENMAVSSLGKVIWLGFLLQCAIFPVGIGIDFVQRGSDLSGLFKVLPWAFCGWALLMFFGIARSVVQLRHPESNKSTPIRIAIFGLILFSWIFMAIAGMTEGEIVIVVLLLDFAMLTILSPTFLLESSKVGRKAMVDMPKKRWHRILMLPLLPTSGTGILFIGGLMILTVFMAQAVVALQPASVKIELNLEVALYMASCLIGYVGIFIPIFSDAPWLNTPKRKRQFALLYFPISVLPFALMSLMTLDGAPFEIFGTHFAPVTLIDKVDKDVGMSVSLGIWGVIMLGATILSNYIRTRESITTLVNVQEPDAPPAFEDSA